MYRFKVYDSKGQPISFEKTYKNAEKARIEYLKRTNDNAYIVDILAQRKQLGAKQ